MSAAAKKWVFRALAALTGVALTAIVAIKADPAHYGVWFPIVAMVQTFVVAALGKLIAKWTSDAPSGPSPSARYQ
jgi:hypothetical protein